MMQVGGSASPASGREGLLATGPVANAQERAADNVVHIGLTSPLVGPVLARVVSMMLVQSDWPLDRLDDALLVCDALSAHAPAYARDDRLSFRVQADDLEVELRLLSLTAEDAARLLGDAKLPVVGNLFESVAERVSVESDEQGSSELVLVLSSSS